MTGGAKETPARTGVTRAKKELIILIMYALYAVR